MTKIGAVMVQKPAIKPGKQKTEMPIITLNPANHVCRKGEGTMRVVGCSNTYLFNRKIMKPVVQHRSVNAIYVISSSPINVEDYMH